jgi:hypothetical protein
MKLVAEVEHPQLENDELLENMLCSTICAIVSKDSALYDNGETSSYLTVDDFTRFVLVPFVTVSLIAEDLSFKDFQSALIERNVSNDFGELFHPEDDNNDIVHEIHRQNVLWIRANIGAEEEEKIQRKLKVSILIFEQFLTIILYRSACPLVHRLQYRSKLLMTSPP